MVKSVKKMARGLPEEVVDLMLEAVGSLVRPSYLKSRGLHEAKGKGGPDGPRQGGHGGYGGYGGYGRRRSPGYGGGAAPQDQIGYSPSSAPQIVYSPASAPAPAPTWYGLAAGAPPPLALAGGAATARNKVGKHQQDPTRSFPQQHFVKPCMYCNYPAHAGDQCWKTFPELRSLNMAGP